MIQTEEDSEMIELTAEQQSQVRASGWPPPVLDPSTGAEYVLLNTALFERVRRILEAEDGIADIEEMNALVSEAINDDDAGARESA
jgi:hypothetical protein